MKKLFVLVSVVLLSSFAEAKQSHICGSEFDVSFADYQVEQAISSHQARPVLQSLKKIAAYQKQAHVDLNQIAELEARADASTNPNFEYEQTLLAALHAEVVANCFRIVELQSL